jgi:hypothetical protein
VMPNSERVAGVAARVSSGGGWEGNLALMPF